jgi:Ca2+-binding RTX toxin-like protein
MIWNPGDDNDLNEGGAGSDTVEVNGGNGAEAFTVAASPDGTRVRFDRVNPAPFSLDIGGSENLVVNANGGDDNVSAGTGLANLIQITVDGGDGNDVLNGGDGADVLRGGAGDDFIDGNRGDDVAFLGDGNDAFQWDPGDGSDTVEGQAGTDTLQFNGANAAENIDVSANGPRVRFFRDVATITMDLDDVERINFEALGGADNIVVNDLTGTDVTEVNLRLAGTLGGNAGDGQQDRIIINGTAGADSIKVVGNGAGVSVNGLAATVNITGHEAANDQLTVNGLAGADAIDASGLVAGVIQLTLDGGDDADSFIGSAGDDLVIGRRGDDVAFLGDGNDTFVWNPGDGSDVEEGQGGTDTLQFNGANANENIDISANGGRARFFRDVATVTMDLNDVERINFEALGGSDAITVNDLTGTDVSEVNLRLAGTLGGNTGDGQPDTVNVNGTNGNDAITVAGDPTSVAVTGLAARVNITGADAAGDLLGVNALAGNDAVNASGLAAGSIGFRADGGAGDDVLTGGAGDDSLVGGPGVDTLDGGPGNDVETQD